MEREVGGGIGMGNICKPMAVSFQCMTKFTTNKKKKTDHWLSACLVLWVRVHMFTPTTLVLFGILVGSFSQEIKD